ncbi:hypothetical protein LCGC14_1704260 [marine sediment metagenome]|uniref:Uncharacterized protein n=1 Tax=marine sediment metagenome TaxID=412755 RepID=A0A0F9JXK8_9ZZZZ
MSEMMWAELVEDEGILVWLTNEENSKSTGEYRQELRLKADTFPKGTKVVISWDEHLEAKG